MSATPRNPALHPLWQWLTPPSAMTTLCVLCDEQVPAASQRALAQTLAVHANIAVLSVANAAALEHQWLAQQARGPGAALSLGSRGAGFAVDTLDDQCVLLLWSQDFRRLGWLAGVLGQKLLYLPCDDPMDTADGLPKAVGAVLTVLREMVRRDVTA